MLLSSLREDLLDSAQKDLEHKEENHVASVETKAKLPLLIVLPTKEQKCLVQRNGGGGEVGGGENAVLQLLQKKMKEKPWRKPRANTVPGVPPAREKVLKSTEEQEIEKRLGMQQKVVEMQRKNEEFKKLTLARPGQPVKKSTMQLTKTVDFCFLIDERIKQHPKKQEEYKEVNFMSELR